VERTDLTDVLQQSVTMAESKAPRGNVVVTTKVEPGLPMLDGDHHQLSQVFTNLVANAFEALDGKGHITISAVTTTIEADPALAGVQPPTPAVLVEVADDGPGISAELTDRIFNPFFTTKVTGTGLGLAIVRKIVDAHDGRIDVISAAETGTRFRVTLPVTLVGASGWFK
jgi:signal transduction histidine kinase